jgi:hypothetical protein
MAYTNPVDLATEPTLPSQEVLFLGSLSAETNRVLNLVESTASTIRDLSRSLQPLANTAWFDDRSRTFRKLRRC